MFVRLGVCVCQRAAWCTCARIPQTYARERDIGMRRRRQTRVGVRIRLSRAPRARSPRRGEHVIYAAPRNRPAGQPVSQSECTHTLTNKQAEYSVTATSMSLGVRTTPKTLQNGANCFGKFAGRRRRRNDRLQCTMAGRWDFIRFCLDVECGYCSGY